MPCCVLFFSIAFNELKFCMCGRVMTWLFSHGGLGLRKLISLSFFVLSPSLYLFTATSIKAQSFPLSTLNSPCSIQGYNLLLHLMKHSIFKVVVSSFCQKKKKKKTTFIIYLSNLETFSCWCLASSHVSLVFHVWKTTPSK